MGALQKVTDSSADRAHDLQVWEADLRQPQAWIDEVAARVLAAEELRELATSASELSRRRLVARIATRVALARRLGCAPNAVRFTRTALGKPELADDVGDGTVHFNISHSEDCLLIAITSLGPVGADVEHVREIEDVEAIARSRFAPEEADAIGRLMGFAQLRAFYNCWTRKEAYLKAGGSGLMGQLEDVVVNVDDGGPSILSLADDDAAAWTLLAVLPRPDAVGAVALRVPNAAFAGAVETKRLAMDLDQGWRP